MSKRRTGDGRPSGEPAPHEVVARTIRVDHAGEYEARRIHRGQLAMPGRPAAMAWTVAALEQGIDGHYRAQTEAFGEDDPPLRAEIERFRADEPEHRDIRLEHGAQQARAYRLLSAAIKAGCRAAIRIGERV